jgi:hypothetical protein
MKLHDRQEESPQLMKIRSAFVFFVGTMLKIMSVR